MNDGMAQLMECVTLLLSKVEAIDARLGDRVPRAEDMTRPMSAAELCERWGVELRYLPRRCRAYGLRPLKGGRGAAAVYSREDVLRAESFASGKSTRRKFA